MAERRRPTLLVTGSRAFPAVAADRLWRRWRTSAAKPASDLRPHHPATNAVLTGICFAESIVARHNRAFGLTAFGIAEKI